MALDDQCTSMMLSHGLWQRRREKKKSPGNLTAWEEGTSPPRLAILRIYLVPFINKIIFKLVIRLLAGLQRLVSMTRPLRSAQEFLPIYKLFYTPSHNLITKNMLYTMHYT